MNRFGKPAVARPRYVRGPAAHFSASVTPPRPRRSISRSAPVIASKPMAKTMTSSSYSASAVRMPRGVTSWIGAVRTSTSSTLSRLYVTK
jgi:hypothetical protein